MPLELGGVDELTRAARRARGGDPAAIAAVIRGTQADVWRLCAHLVDRESADDLTQQTFLRALRSLPRFRADTSARAWLLTIARRTCMDELRARYRRRRFETGRPPAGDGEPAGGDVAGWVDLTLLLGQLDPERRSAFVLTQMLGCSYQEAAEICGCPVGTIRSRIARARTDLITLLRTGEPDAAGPDGAGEDSRSSATRDTLADGH